MPDPRIKNGCLSKRCPYCGGPLRVIGVKHGSFITNPKTPGWHVYCGDCSQKITLNRELTRDQAIKHALQRPIEDALANVVLTLYKRAGDHAQAPLVRTIREALKLAGRTLD